MHFQQSFLTSLLLCLSLAPFNLYVFAYSSCSTTNTDFFFEGYISYILQLFQYLPLFSEASLSTQTYQLWSLYHLSNTIQLPFSVATSIFCKSNPMSHFVSSYYHYLCLRFPYAVLLLYLLALI